MLQSLSQTELYQKEAMASPNAVMGSFSGFFEANFASVNETGRRHSASILPLQIKPVKGFLYRYLAYFNETLHEHFASILTLIKQVICIFAIILTQMNYVELFCRHFANLDLTYQWHFMLAF
jgi:hypothetical protein